VDEQVFKRRLVGTIVLVALAVIFLPMLLPGNREDVFKETAEVIPPKPAELEKLKVLELENPVKPPPPREVVRIPVDEKTPKTPPRKTGKATATVKSGEKPAVKVKPATKSKAKPKAWAVQVGSFSKRANAMRLRDKLRRKGYTAFVERLESRGQLVYRVRVGPEVKRSKAEKLQKEIRSALKINGLVVSHP